MNRRTFLQAAALSAASVVDALVFPGSLFAPGPVEPAQARVIDTATRITRGDSQWSEMPIWETTEPIGNIDLGTGHIKQIGPAEISFDNGVTWHEAENVQAKHTFTPEKSYIQEWDEGIAHPTTAITFETDGEAWFTVEGRLVEVVVNGQALRLLCAP